MSGHDLAVVTPGTPLPPARTSPQHSVRGLRSTKIHDRHLDRLAIVYVRQSSPHQVFEHQESRERQYALADHAVTLGWPQERVLTIDDDQGQSGQTAENRRGFQRLLAEVTMDHVGLILGLEMSRLARSCKDWHHLLEVCALFGTLLGDQDGVYDANDTNDRLLLGLKGTMSEVELFTMRNRLDRGKLHKAERGELFFKVPLGYVKLATGEVVLDPDEQVRSIVQLLFDKFDELGTLYGLFRYLVRHKIRLGMRIQNGPARGQLEWRPPALPTLNQVLHNPIYAGAYAYGRRPSAPRKAVAGRGAPGSRWLPMSEWKVLLYDRLPAYITWERYLANQERLTSNRSLPGSLGTPRRGVALLGGLLVCGNCGRCFRTAYRHQGKASYNCERHLLQDVEQVCHGLQAAPIDELVARQILRAIEPAAIELSLQAMENVRQERDRLHCHWKQRLERARYESQRAERQYAAVEPENRLVARTLEQRWEGSLCQERQLEDDYDRFLREQPAQLSNEERMRIVALSRDLPTLWHAPGTTPADRKEIIRLLVERVVVEVQPDSEHVGATIHWCGGGVTSHQIVRPVLRYEQLRDYRQLIDQIQRWWRQGETAAQIAVKLNAAGFRTPKARRDYTAYLVQRMLARRGLRRKELAHEQLDAHEQWLPKLAQELKLPENKLRSWVVRGWAHARKTSWQGLWIVWADARERNRLQRLAASSKRGVVAHPASLTTPRPKTGKTR